MACEVCEHCQSPVSHDEGYIVQKGFSYHNKCHKCYVCSETNLLNAEVFKGVIFCSSCSKRIFQGCATARLTKTVVKPHKPRPRSRRRSDRVRTQDRRSERVRPGVIERTIFGQSSGSDSRSCSDDVEKLSKLSKTLESAMQDGKKICDNNIKSIKKSSVEIGMTTDFTQELLRQMNCPVVAECKNKSASPAELHKKYKGDNIQNSPVCSDLRIAGLGISTEIANMALRKKSELPVIIKSESRLKRSESVTLSILNQESDLSTDGNEEWFDSAYSSLKESVRTHWLDRRIGSILKLPYKCFKRNILNRSSLISVLMRTEHNKINIIKKLKLLFYEEITDHQRRGIKRLYSTINRRKPPYKLGWIELMTKVSGGFRCRHMRTSHSYRCMRAQVMKIAGPTKSELAVYRMKIKNIMAPSFLRNIIACNKKCAAIMLSQACGSDLHQKESISQRIQKIIK